DGGGEVRVVDAGAMGCGGGGSGDGDVGERGEVVECEALGVDDWGEIPVADAGADGDGAGLLVDGDLIEVVEGDLRLGAVGDGVEGVAGAEGAKFGVVFHEVLELGDGGGVEEVGGVVGEVAGPVGEGFGRLFLGGCEAGEEAAGHEGS